MRGSVLAMVLAAGMLVPGARVMAAFPADEVVILGQKEIVALSDDKLIDAYIDILAEMEASKTFHTTSGFTPKEYRQYKELVKYRLQVLLEIHRRKLEIPPTLN